MESQQTWWNRRPPGSKILRWTLAWAAVVVLLFGCSASKPLGWHPKSKQEMKALIGQTVMEAVHQYRMQLWKNGVEVPKVGSHMNKEVPPAAKLSPGSNDGSNRV